MTIQPAPTNAHRHKRLRYKEAKAHAFIVAAVGWLAILAFAFVGHGDRSPFGPLKWADFVHFYTLGDIARHANTPLLYDVTAQHAHQSALVAASAADGFIPVYGPQTALLFAPLSMLPYFTAGFLWSLVTMALYAWAVWLAWRPARHVLTDRRFVMIASVAFPPVFQLVGHGQVTAVVLVAFAGGWWALEARRPVIAGAVLSLLAIKPQWGLVLAPLAIVMGEGRLVVGGLVGVGVQMLAVWAVFGERAFVDYGAALRQIPAIAPLLEPQAYKMHSLGALTQLLPDRAGIVTWAIVSLVVVAATILVWRKVAAWRVRFGVLVLASALVNPHLTIYDVIVMALPVLWIGGWLLEQQDDSTWFWQRVYWICAALLFPTAVLVKIQLSPILIGELFARIVGVVSSSAAELTNPPRNE